MKRRIVVRIASIAFCIGGVVVAQAGAVGLGQPGDPVSRALEALRFC